ncbi:MAG: hypothetical protein KIT87_18610 [Anaerolineae bacterium]|nr:hypothetical protein [Anaerolineae bacterium]
MLDVPSLLRLMLLIPLLLVLPGSALMACLPAPCHPEARASTIVEAAWRVVLASLVLSGWTAEVLAELGQFRLRTFLLVVVVGSLALWAIPLLLRRQPLRATLASVFSASSQYSVVSSQYSAFNPLSSVLRLPPAVFPLTLFLGALALFARPHETILGAADAGVYIARAAHIVRTGGIVVHEPTLAALPADQTAQLLQVVPETPDIPLRFPGVYAVDPAHGVSLPQFFPLFPAWLAVFYALGGVWASLWALPLFGALGVLSVYYAGRWAVGPTAAAVGAIGLTLLAPQVWFSRYTTTETFTQALLWTGVAAFAVYVAADAPPRLGVLAGLTLGAVLLTRIDTPFVLALPVGLALWGLLRAQPATGRLTPRALLLDRPRTMLARYGAFLLPMTLLAAHASLHALLFAYPYVESTSGILTMRELAPAAGLVVGVALGSLAVIAWRSRRLVSLRTAPLTVSAGGRPQPSIAFIGLSSTQLGAVVQPVRALLGLGILALGLWAYFIRPLGDETLVYNTWYAGTLVIAKHQTLLQLGWYLSPVGVLLALVGAALAAYQGRGSRVWLLLAVGLLFSLLYLSHPLNNTRHIYVMRRYVPAVLPAFALCAGYALAWVAGPPSSVLRPSSSVRLAMAGLMGAMALVGIVPVTARIIAQSELAGTVEQVARLADRFEPDAVILLRDPDTVGTAAVLGTPLQFIHGRDTFVVQGDIDPPRVAGMLQTWRVAGRPVYIGLADGAAWPTLPGFTLTPLGRAEVNTHVLEAPFDHVPAEWVPHQRSLDLYRVSP